MYSHEECVKDDGHAGSDGQKAVQIEYPSRMSQFHSGQLFWQIPLKWIHEEKENKKKRKEKKKEEKNKVFPLVPVSTSRQ